MLEKNIIIFTDLDGTLLDHNTYSFEAALPMLDFIKKQKIPLIIVTSKTKSEVIHIQKLLGLKTPFIVENGAGIFIPKEGEYEMIPLGCDYQEVRSAFVRYAKHIAMRGFFDMNIGEISEYTGLDAKSAADAKARSFSEPFVLEDEKALSKLLKMAEKDGLDVVKGGRFYHLITKGQDKAKAMKTLVARYEKEKGCSFKTVALGDSPNDLTMLKNVDTPILIPRPDGSYMPCDIAHISQAPFPGARGWNTAMKEYFNVQ